MKVAIPVEGNSITAAVCPSFGRAPYFLVYDLLAGAGVFVHNSAADSQGGAGIKAAQIVADHQAEALLVPRCGENAAQALETAGIKLYKTVSLSVQECLDAFSRGELAALTEIHPGFHGQGGQR